MRCIICTVQQIQCVAFYGVFEHGRCYEMSRADADFRCDKDTVIGKTVEETPCGTRVRFEVLTAVDVKTVAFRSDAAELSRRVPYSNIHSPSSIENWTTCSCSVFEQSGLNNGVINLLKPSGNFTYDQV
jgi:hypothetical protein